MAHKHPTCFFLPDGIIWQENWIEKIYHEEDVVTYEGSPYVCIKNTMDPTLKPTESETYWKPFDPANYVGETWKPKFYPEGSLVTYQGDTYLCWKKATLEPPTNESYWTKAKYNFQGGWKRQAYFPGTIVTHKNQYYQCLKKSFTEKPNNYVHWKVIEPKENQRANEWKPMRYNLYDVVSYEAMLYVCISATSIDDPSDDHFWQPLPVKTKWMGVWRKDSYPVNTLVLNDDKNIYVSRIEATDEDLSSDAWLHLSHINWRHVWINQDYSAGDYLIYDQRAFICIKNTVNADHPTDPKYWTMFCDGGVEFPPWFPHPRIIEINIPFDEDLEYSPSSGGYYWSISPPKYLGFEEITIDKMFEENRPYFQKLGVNKVKQIYMLTEWHVGEYIKEGEDPEKFYGAVIDGYYEPPANINLQNKKLAQDLIPMVNPKTGKPGYRFYIQWRASELPFIAQPDRMDFLVLFNREPHPKITEFFKVAANHLQISNRLRMDKAAFEDEMRDVISYSTYQDREAKRLSEAEEKGEEFKPTSYDDYVEDQLAVWTQNKYQMKMVHLQLGNALFKKAEEHTKTWLDHQVKSLKSCTREISTMITSSVQQHIGWDKWFNLSAAQCKKIYPNITWSVKGEHYKLSDIEEKREDLERMWEIYETGPIVGKAKFLDYLERDINKVLALFPTKTIKRKNGRRRRGKK
jgi:hypothetical protein